MTSLLDKVCDRTNLQWAWEKVKRASVPGDIWINEADLAHFEVHLEREIQGISASLRRKSYSISPIRPMAFPKNPSATGKPRVRQYFNFATRDQVAWVAAVNVLGPLLDARMPQWSYGNRLFRTSWIDEDDNGAKRRKIGPYRHSSGRIYRPFQQAWPLFRRHVALSIYAATNNSDGEAGLDPDDRDELELQNGLANRLRCPYLQKAYWQQPLGNGKVTELFWASVDLEKFYPSISLASCVQTILQALPSQMREEAGELLRMLTKLPIDLSGWYDEDLRHIELDGSRRFFRRIPTGLLVSGFLANAALLKVDQAVEQHLPRGRIAHFRYVDDHIVLAASFEELVDWLKKYQEILSEHGSGARYNESKTEPESLGRLLPLIARGRGEHQSTEWKSAEDACRLDPAFPTPLMTKTIALVSAIGKKDFTLLEDAELGILTQQLEHLLLVEHAETEMPERTRLAFAATRLARVAEARLASPEMMIANARKTGASSEKSGVSSGKSKDDHLLESLSGVDDAMLNERLAQMANRVFGLIRRVLREKPDRVRLWTHALVIARRLGASALEQLFQDIAIYGADPVNRLAADYVLGNSFSVLAAETIRAAQILTDGEAAGWRRVAALRFLRGVAAFSRQQRPYSTGPWFVTLSFEQFCLGLYCADNLLKRSVNNELRFNPLLISRGFGLLISTEAAPNERVAHAWWAAKFELGRPVRQAPRLVIELGRCIQALPESNDFWSFFPCDSPPEVIERLAKDENFNRERDGWWFDAFHCRPVEFQRTVTIPIDSKVGRMRAALASPEPAARLSLPIWANAVWKHKPLGEDVQWRLGEWACLEIVRQAAELLGADGTFDSDYVHSASRTRRQVQVCAHPFNFTLPTALLHAQASSWEQWRSLLRGSKGGTVRLAAARDRINDYRYAPLTQSFIGASQNQIRGLGLCLFGLLSKSFLLPIQWNGFGHENVLRYLGALLRSQITYSSATLGILEACLQPRVSENTMARLHQSWFGEFDDDTDHDPVSPIDVKQLALMIVKAQTELEQNQISTFNLKSRQVTPIKLMHLTEPNWKEYFGGIQT